MYVTCVALLLHNCAMGMRGYFKNIDEVVATIKNKDRKNDFHEAGYKMGILTQSCLVLLLKPFCSSYHCQQLDKWRPLSQQSERRYQCE